ncbi:hypothetical protein B0H11DRAFT_2281266 [Mycena galericulata]|nr:hypothetical protein B0H11DRAFT_2281266 [Mycena galericulata]
MGHSSSFRARPSRRSHSRQTVKVVKTRKSLRHLATSMHCFLGNIYGSSWVAPSGPGLPSLALTRCDDITNSHPSSPPA